ncbi:14253_t:CDS:2, partial [Acaulospora colombiana]
MKHQPNGELCTEAFELEVLVSKMKDLMVEYVDEGRKPGAPVVKCKSPEELKRLINLDLDYGGTGIEGLIPLIRNVLSYSVNTWNPGFMDKLYAGTNPVGVISEMLVTLLNANSHVYHVSPALTLIENAVSKSLAKLFGMGEKSGGITCPGGAFSNQLAMITARNHMFPEIKTRGYFSFNKKLVIFTSNAGHYSVKKTAITLGLGTDCVVEKHWILDIDEIHLKLLEQLIKLSLQRGEVPFFINATAGTTILGAFDPLREIGKIAKQYNIWFHVDGSWGGSLVFSEKYKSRIDGSDLADSLVINPHKMLGTPLQCSFLLAQNSQIFAHANSLGAEYLFHQDGSDSWNSQYDLGDRWKIFGIEGYRLKIEHSFKMSEYLLRRLKVSKRFRLVLEEPENLQICFWYIPEGIEECWFVIREDEECLDCNGGDRASFGARNGNVISSGMVNGGGYGQKENDASSGMNGNGYELKVNGENGNHVDQSSRRYGYLQKYIIFKHKLSNITKEIHHRIRKNGKYMFDYSPVTLRNLELPLFFRVVVNSPAINEKFLDGLVEEIERIGEEVTMWFAENERKREWGEDEDPENVSEIESMD